MGRPFLADALSVAWWRTRQGTRISGSMRPVLRSAVLAASLLTACKGASSSQQGGGQAVARVEIAPVAVLLTTVGQTRILGAKAFDAQGGEVTSAVAWSSSRPDDVSVGPDGSLVAKRLGSAQIFATAGGIQSPPALVVVAQPAPGALLVTDAQVVSVAPPVLAAGEVPGVGTRYEVRLTGVTPAPATGTVVLGSETAPVAGRVVSTRVDAGALVVTLALAPLYEVLDAYHLDLSIDLAPYQVIAATAATGLRAWSGQRSLEAGAPPLADVVPKLVEPFKPADCTGGFTVSMFKKNVGLGIENGLHLVVKDDKDPGNPPSYSKLALAGSLALTGTVEIGLDASVSATGTCIAQVKVDLPVFGWLSALVMPGVRLGAGVQLNAKLTAATATLGVTGKYGLTTEFGWECGPIPLTCHGLSTLDQLNELTPKVEAPRATGMRVDVSAQVFALVGLDLVFFKGLGGDFAIAEARVGPKQSGNKLAREDDQAHEAATRSNYDLVVLGTLEPGSGLQAAIKKIIDDEAVGVTLKSEFTHPLSESPNGAFSVDRVRAGLNQKVKFTVDLVPKSLNYLGLDYNVDSIHFRRKTENGNSYDEIPALTIQPSASNQSHFTVDWTPTQADSGKNDIAAFVRTTLPVLPDLEIADDSRKQVEVLPFCQPAAVAGGFPMSSAQALVQQAVSGCGGTLKHVEVRTFAGVGGGTMTRTATAQVQLTKDEEASAPTVWVLRPTGTWSFEESGNIGACTVTIAPFGGTWTPQPPLGSGPGAILLYVFAEPYRYEGDISLTDSTGDYVYFNEVWSCPEPEGTHTQVVYFGPSNSFDLFRVGSDQQFDAGPSGTALQGSYQSVDQANSSTDSYEWNLSL
jgi:hypothetical protein